MILQPGTVLECIGPLGPDSRLRLGARYTCVATDGSDRPCVAHPGRPCGGVMVEGVMPAVGFWYCERLFKPVDAPEVGVRRRELLTA